MNGKLTAYVAVAIAVFLLSPQVAQSKALENYTWIEVRSDNFVIHSLLSKRQTEKVARYLEMARAVLPQNLLHVRRDVAAPEVIYLVKGPSQINELGRGGDVFYFSDYDDAKYMVVGADVYAENRVLAPYAQFLVREGLSTRASMWYEFGMINYFRSARISDGRFRYGGQRFQQIKNPNVIAPRVERLISADDITGLSNVRLGELSYYSWIVMRYLTESHEDWQAYGDRLGQYIELVEQHGDPAAAFETAFGIKVQDLGEAIAVHSADCCGEYVISVDEVLPEFEVEVTRLNREQISLGLGTIASDMGAADRALELFEIALGSEATRDAAQAGIDALAEAAHSAEAGN